jgi:pyruvate/2-oxoglutarate/acetoin dehydrogenase E1 component/TPP-dependent pyruvate/acetoin dehydrogenase alpha subunit
MIADNLSDLIPDLQYVGEFAEYKKQVIQDYWVGRVSREASNLCRKEVLTGKAKFGISGDGKELAQIALAKNMKPGDWRSGYYRDQTILMSLGICDVRSYFSQLYSDTVNDPFSGGRQMNCHFSTPMLDEKGQWLSQMEGVNMASDVSCTAGQVAKGIGFALASSLYRKIDHPTKHLFTDNGNEVSFCIIGDASTSEGAFWETMNAAAVMKVPMLMAIWDDGYGISVPTSLQTVKASISKALSGFQIDEDGDGIYIFNVKAWDYQELCTVFEVATNLCRKHHIPCLVHVEEMTQPNGHSSSGSHERYKSQERLQWEQDYDGLHKMQEWMLANHIITTEELHKLDSAAADFVKKEKEIAYQQFLTPINKCKEDLLQILNAFAQKHNEVNSFITEVNHLIRPFRTDLLRIAKRVSYFLLVKKESNDKLNNFIKAEMDLGHENYSTHLHSETEKSALNQPIIAPKYSESSATLSGYMILNTYFDQLLGRRSDVIAFGEDVGNIGDVNQGFAGLNKKYGDHRVFDVGIREWTIIGQALGTAMRGMRPIAEIQYLDYINYAISPLSDDLACLRYRSDGKQMAPAIIRTRGHRLEGIWHTGSPMGLILNSMKGIYLCVPRNMVQAAGMYNTLLNSDDPAIVVECLNGYRLKEVLPDNHQEFTIPLGRAEVLAYGKDITIVSYGSTLREVLKAAEMLKELSISAEVIDVQTLMPFDLEGVIVGSLKKTNKILFVDEDVPGGATAFMMREVLDKQDGYKYLDAKAICLAAKEHRTPYGTDGDYFGKPNHDEIIEAVFSVLKS